MVIGKRCYVSNLAWRTSWQDLKDKFRECGSVVYANVTRGEDGEGMWQCPACPWGSGSSLAAPAAAAWHRQQQQQQCHPTC
jgi:hypothetical protein